MAGVKSVPYTPCCADSATMAPRQIVIRADWGIDSTHGKRRT